MGGFLRIISKNGWNDIFAGRNLLAMRFFCICMYVHGGRQLVINGLVIGADINY